MPQSSPSTSSESTRDWIFLERRVGKAVVSKNQTRPGHEEHFSLPRCFRTRSAFPPLSSNVVRGHSGFVDGGQPVLRWLQSLGIQRQTSRRRGDDRDIRSGIRGWHLLVRGIRAEVAVIGAAWRAAQLGSVRLGVASGVRRVLVGRMVLVGTGTSADPRRLVVMVMVMRYLTRGHWRRWPVLVHLVVWLA